MTRILFLELNEVPQSIFEDSFLRCKYNKKLSSFKFHSTISRDKGHLSPWTTWATVYRGVTDKVHKITDINQDVSEIDKDFPTITSTLADKGYKVGVVGSMHSASVPQKEYHKYAFFVPEAFASNYLCKPKTINNLQKLNLIMSKKSARVVDNTLPSINILIKAAASYLNHAYKFNGALSVIKQLFSELLFPWKKIRRRTLQSIILFDVFMDLLNTNNPDFCTFFTNHVASNMHRFWEAKFPEDYPKEINLKRWKKRYKNEIDIAMQVSSYFINELVKYVDKNTDSELWILSSMGQAAVKDYSPQSMFWKINNLSVFINSICGENFQIEELTQMIPCYSIKADPDSIDQINNKLKNIKSNSNFIIRSKTKTTLAFFFQDSHNDEIWFQDKSTKNIIDVKGINKVNIDENTGSSAYHVPEGILYRYGTNLKCIEKFLDSNNKLETNKIKSILEEIIS